VRGLRFFLLGVKAPHGQALVARVAMAATADMHRSQGCFHSKQGGAEWGLRIPGVPGAALP
jgi:hypothetical protein